MSKLKLSVSIGILMTLVVGVTVYANYSKIEALAAKFELQRQVLQQIQFEKRQIENKEREQLTKVCEILKEKASLMIQEEEFTEEQKAGLLAKKQLDCATWYTNSLSGVYLEPSDLYYVFLKSSGVYETQSFKQHFSRNGYMATDIATGGKKLDVYAPSFISEKGKDESREYTVKIVKNYETMGLTVELHWEEDGINYGWAIGHLNKIADDIKNGSTVKTGDIIGFSGGCVGELQFDEKSTGCHSHLEFRVEGVAVPYPTFAYTVHYGENGKPEIVQEKEDLGTGWRISTYYSVMEGQKKYFNGGYKGDKAMNCGEGDCLVTASGYTLTKADSMKIVACPKNYSFGTRFEIEGFGEVRCEDVGGAINGKHLDLWVGIGDEGYTNVGQGSSKNAHVYLIK